MTDHQYGPKGHIVDAFITHIKGMTQDDWDKFYAARDAAWGAAGYAAWEAAWYAAGSAARCAARYAAGYAAWYAAWDAARDAARDAAWGAAGYAAWEAAWYAAWEIQGADLLRDRGQPFFFLPMFGFADEKAVIAALQPKEGEG